MVQGKYILPVKVNLPYVDWPFYIVCHVRFFLQESVAQLSPGLGTGRGTSCFQYWLNPFVDGADVVAKLIS